jgi:hypothetical protein
MNREAAIARMAEATADLGDSYLEITRKKRSSETKRYEVTYRFQVGDRGYEGKESLQAAPTQSLYRVHYLPEDPSFNALNPSKLLDWPTLSAILSGVLCGVGAVILALELLAGAGPKRAAPGR